MRFVNKSLCEAVSGKRANVPKTGPRMIAVNALFAMATVFNPSFSAAWR